MDFVLFNKKGQKIGEHALLPASSNENWLLYDSLVVWGQILQKKFLQAFKWQNKCLKIFVTLPSRYIEHVEVCIPQTCWEKMNKNKYFSLTWA